MKLIRSAVLCAAFALSASAATLIHSYDFSSGVTDGTGSENGTLNGGAAVSGGVLNLDGDGDYVQFGAGLIPTSGSFSVLISARLLVSLPQGYYMETMAQGGGFYLGPAAVSGDIRVGDAWGNAGAYPTDGAWHTFAVVSDQGLSQTSLYIDGELYTFRAGTTNPAAVGTVLGKQYHPHNEYFNGQLDDLRIYTGALTAGEVFTLSNGSSEVPEPLTMALTGAGLIAFGLRRKLRAKHHQAG
jgi:hypothetical protein